MAEGFENRGKKDDFGTRAFGPPEFLEVMRRGGYQAAGTEQARPAAAAQMQAGAECGRQAGVAGDDQRDFSGAAEGRDLGGKLPASGDLVVAEDDAGERIWQCGDGRERVGQALCVREQPEHRIFSPPALLYRTRPGQ